MKFFLFSISVCLAAVQPIPNEEDGAGETLMPQDTSLLRYQRNVFKQNRDWCRTESEEIRKNSLQLLLNWRRLEHLIVLDQMVEIYGQFVESQDQKIALFEKLIDASISNSNARKSRAVAALRKSVDGTGARMQNLIDIERFMHAILRNPCSQANHVCDDMISFDPLSDLLIKEDAKRFAFCNSTLPNTQYGLSSEAVQLLDRLTPGSIPVLVRDDENEFEFFFRERDVFAKWLFEYAKKSLPIRHSKFWVVMPDSSLKSPKDILLVGMRLSTLYLMAHNPDTGYLHLYAE